MQPPRHVRTSETFQNELAGLDADGQVAVVHRRQGDVAIAEAATISLRSGRAETIHYGASLIPVTVAEPA